MDSYLLVVSGVNPRWGDQNESAVVVRVRPVALHNTFAWALAIDAITHDGPANISRIDLDRVCHESLAPALRLKDMFGTEGLLFIAVMELLVYTPHAAGEPPIKGYASSG